MLWIISGIAGFLVICLLFLARVSGRRISRILRHAQSDTVTQALNAVGLYQEADKLFSQQDAKYAFVTMDVRNFWQIHQTFGSHDSDRCLVYLYGILKANLSSAEPIGRISSGTFCFLLKNRQEDAICARLTRIYESANQFNQQRKIPYSLNLHFGIHIPNGNTESIAEIQEKSMQALHACTDDSRCRFYRENTGDSPSRKWELIEQVEHSLRNGDFLVYMQPKIRLSDNRVVGAEALVRWRHPQRGMLSPEMFIPLLEEYHIMYRFDRRLFEMVCHRLAHWQALGWKPCPVSVNLSRENIAIPNCMEPYARLCRQYGISPDLVEFELCESILQEDPQKIRALIDEIHNHGFHCALDNFGGESIPLHLLRELNVDTIKLDASFFSIENNSRRNRFVLEAVLKITSQMQIRTVAQGIDNASQIQYLQQAGCDIVQGYFFFRPMPLEEFQTTIYQNGDLRYIGNEGAHAIKAAALPASRKESSNIIQFSLSTSEDRIEFSHAFSPALDGQAVISNATALFRQSGLIHENDRKDFFHLLDRCRRESGWVEDTVRFYTGEGRYEWLDVHLHSEDLPSAGDTFISGTLVNVAGWKHEVNRWKEKANRDALTGLYNREYFELYTSNALETGHLSSAAIIFVDVDDFKKVNDTLGHMVGDDVLCCVAKRILGIFRHTDIVARYGGDEFVVFVNGIARADLEKRLAQLCEVFRFPYRNDTIEYQISGSIGAAMFPDNGRSYSELLDHADCALYVAKRQGKNQFMFYHPGLEELVPEK